MKKLKYLYLLVGAIFIATSCTDFVDPAIPYKGFDTGTYLKTITTPAAHNFFDLDNAKFSVVLECHAIDKINNVKNVDVMVRHRRGNTLSPEVKLTTVEGSAFTTTADSKWPRGTVASTVKEVLTKMGKTKADLNGGDFIEYRLILNTLDNKVFSSNNLSGNVVADPYYNSPFLYRVAIVCPSALAGTYTSETTGKSTDDCCPTETSVSSTVTLTAGTTAGSYTISDFTAGLYFKFYEVYGIGAAGPGPATISDACGSISGSFGEPFGSTVKVVGGVNTATGVITYTWENGYGDKGTVVLTPKK